MRIRVNFVRPYEIFYLGHLDMKTLIERGLRRTMLPLKYTEGFNKRVQLELGFPLSVGMVGEDEYFDFFLKDEISEEQIFSSLNEAFKALLQIKRIKLLPEYARALTSFEAVFTNIVMGHFIGEVNFAQFEDSLNELLKKTEIPVEREGKLKDVRKFIDGIGIYNFDPPHFKLLLTTLYLKVGSIEISELEEIVKQRLPLEFEYTIREKTLLIDKGKLISPFDVEE
jgi:radical SAM-linked protein